MKNGPGSKNKTSKKPDLKIKSYSKTLKPLGRPSKKLYYKKTVSRMPDQKVTVKKRTVKNVK